MSGVRCNPAECFLLVSSFRGGSGKMQCKKSPDLPTPSEPPQHPRWHQTHAHTHAIGAVMPVRIGPQGATSLRAGPAVPACPGRIQSNATAVSVHAVPAGSSTPLALLSPMRPPCMTAARGMHQPRRQRMSVRWAVMLGGGGVSGGRLPCISLKALVCVSEVF